MASEGTRSAVFLLLIINLILYLIVTVVAAWAVNHGIQRAREAASVLQTPARIFPIYFPIGNMATGFFVIFSLIAGVVGVGTSLLGLQNVRISDPANIHSAAASSIVTWSLTLLALGFACKEIELGWTDSNLRGLEIITIIVSATQMFSTGALQTAAEDSISRQHGILGRV